MADARSFQEQVQTFTLAEINAALKLLPSAAYVTPPSPEQTLASYVATYGAGRNVVDVMQLLGYSPALAARVDARQQAMPSSAIERLAAFLRRPRAEVVWACGGRVLAAPAPGIGRIVG